MGGVVPTPRRAGNPATRSDASRTVDVGGRRGGCRPLLNRAPVHGGSPLARSRPLELAGLPRSWRAAIARRVARATRSKRSSTRRTSPVPLPQRARRAGSDTTLATASYCRATSSTDRAAHVASVARRTHAGTQPTLSRSTTKTHSIEIRITEKEHNLEQAAAAVSGETLNEFIRRAARHEAYRTLGERTHYILDDEAAQRFLTALEQPSPPPNEGYAASPRSQASCRKRDGATRHDCPVLTAKAHRIPVRYND
jgi:uncharacterized protein (DUF1778 family)